MSTENKTHLISLRDDQKYKELVPQQPVPTQNFTLGLTQYTVQVTMSTATRTGTCLCKGVSFTVEGEPKMVFCCYCSDCALGAGGPCQITARYQSSRFSINDPESLVTTYTITETGSGFAKEKYFCKRCGCTLYTVPLADEGRTIVIRPVLIENGLELYKPEIECWMKNRPSYFSGCQEAEQWEAGPTSRK
ncbi:hypothetical protein DTO166G4_1955 [Paecilomyces variotii]|nr:hypothetical protein DTO166G4_1955 [Paecilomyces variotii]KAJ9234641.1 hypothetical protein DTO166G5_4994 [Paecilomyces variotii]